MSNPEYQTVIIGGGLSGLSLAHFIKYRQPEHRLVILEKSERFGGAVKSYRQDGIIAEPGPHGFLDNCKESRQLLLETGLEEECLRASLKEFVRYVYHEGKLKCIEQHPLKLLKAPLIPPLAKLGILRDLFRKPLTGEPSVAEWTEYHFGPALLPYLDAVYTGTYAGDITKLKIDSVMPGVREIEKKHGSIIRGLLDRKKKAAKEGKSRSGLPAMTSFPDGMERLVEKLKERRSEEELRPNCAARKITKRNDGIWEIETDTGNLTARNIVIALPINAALPLLKDISAEHPAPVDKLPEAIIVNIAMTFPEDAPIPPGFGFLIPEQEKKFILGALFSSNMFTDRAPQGQQLVEVLVGGRRHPERVTLNEKELIDRATDDLCQILQLNSPPLLIKCLPINGAIPQLEENSPELLRWKNEIQKQNTNLAICGFGWGGIGVNDMIKASHKIAEALFQKTAHNETSEIKPIYF